MTNIFMVVQAMTKFGLEVVSEVISKYKVMEKILIH